MTWYIILVFILTFYQVSLYQKVANDFDLYGIKIAFNDRLVVTANNLDMSFNVQLSPFPSETTCKINTSSFVHQTNEQLLALNSSCDFIYSVVVPKYHPLDKVPYFVYNCIDRFGNNAIGLYTDMNNNNSCNFEMKDSQIVPGNYSTQDNFVLCMAPDAGGVYGIADDFLIYYNLSSFEILIVSRVGSGLSPRACDTISPNNTISNTVFAVIAGYFQTDDWRAQEMLYLVSFNPIALIDNFEIPSVLYFPLGDPRRNRWVANSRVYLPQNTVSVSIASRSGQVLVGVQSLNSVVILSLNNATNPTGFIHNLSLVSSKQNGVSMGYGKSVAWLDEDGQRAAVLANNYTYATYQWISSSVHVYDIGTDGFNDSSQPIIIYPNSQQILQSQLSPSFIRLVSSFGNVALFDDQGTPFVLLSSPPGTYPTTFISNSFSIEAPCIRGTYSDQYGIELCIPCPNGSYSSRGAIHCSECDSSDNTYCPYGAVAPINYDDINPVLHDESFPDSPDGIIFEDILLQNMFTLSNQSGHCRVVSPLTWVLVVIGLALILVVIIELSTFYSRSHSHRERVRNIAKRIDLIGEGKMWIGGAMSTGIIVFLAFSYAFSSAYYKRYPIEKVGSNSWFGCDDDMRNAKFSSSMQAIQLGHLTEDNIIISNMLNQQPFTLIIDLINTAFTCNDSIVMQRILSNKVMPLEITSCNSSYNESIISLNIALPGHPTKLQLILPGVRTVPAFRIGFKGPGQTNDNGRITLRELDFSILATAPAIDQVLAPLVEVGIYFTPVINQTDPMSLSDQPILSTAWSFAAEATLDEVFDVETRYTFYKRENTIISITLADVVYFVINVEQPIARRNEIIFRSLLFTIIVLELFRLAFLFFKLMFLPLFRLGAAHISKNKKQLDSITDDMSIAETNNTELNMVSVSEDHSTVF